MTFRQILSIPPVRRLWLAQLVSVTGDFLAMFAVLSRASFRMHATPYQITGITISYLLPLAVMGPVAGVLADRRNPRRVMIASDLVRAVLVLLLMFSNRLWQTDAILLAIGTVSTFFLPAQSVVMRKLIPRDALLAANAMMQQALLVIRLLSPAIAGALVARFGAFPCFWLDTLSFLFSAMMLSGIDCRRPAAAGARHRTSTVRYELGEGIRFIAAHSTVSFVLAAMAAATFAISCFGPLIAVFVRDILRSDVRAFSAISASIGLGMIAGTQTVRRNAVRQPARQLVLCGLAVTVSGIVMMGAATAVAVMATGAFLMGSGVGFLMVPAQTLIQSETPVQLLGRVSGGVTALISTAQILGLVLSGFSAATLGLRTMFFTSGGLLGGLALAGYWKIQNEKIRATPLTDLTF